MKLRHWKKGTNMSDMTKHDKTHYLMQFFVYGHLPKHLQDVSRPFFMLAETISEGPGNPETTTALRKLLESKDCAVRAVLFKTIP